MRRKRLMSDDERAITRSIFLSGGSQASAYERLECEVPRARIKEARDELFAPLMQGGGLQALADGPLLSPLNLVRLRAAPRRV